jgi:hypothetical protein
MPLSRADIVKRLRPGLAGLMGKNYARFTEQCKQVFETKKSDKAYEEMIMTVGTGLAPVKPEGDQIFLDTMSDGYTARAEHSVIGLGFAITREAIEDNLYESKSEMMGQNLSRSMGETKELRGASIFNLAFDSGAPIGDGEPLCDTAHPLQFGGTVSNSVSADISDTSLKNAITTIRTDFVDDRQLKIKVAPQKLIVHPDDAFDAFEILKSDLSTSIATGTSPDYGTNTNNVNSLKSRGFFQDFMIYDYLTDSNAWFIMTDVDYGLIHWQRRPLEIDMEYTDPYTGNIITTATERYAFMVGNWRKVYGSAGGS